MYYYHVSNDYSLSIFLPDEHVKGIIIWRNGGKLNRASIEFGEDENGDLVYIRTLDKKDLSGMYI